MAPAEIPDELLRHVPILDLPHDGSCRQASGLELPIAVINLPHRTDRWEAVSTRMAAVGLDRLIKVPAVLGASLSDETIAAVLGRPAGDIDLTPRSHLSLTRPAIGCSLSHLAIWQWMLHSGLPRLLVFEDDAFPAKGHDPERFRRTIEALPAEADLIFVGRMIMAGLADQHSGGGLARLFYFNGTFAYLITPEACRALIRHVLPLRAHLDHQISQILIEQRHAFPAFYTDPQFFEPDWSLRSDVYVPLADDAEADRELDRIVLNTRQLLLGEGRPLLQGPP